MDIRLNNKVAMVTGGSSGIGLACAEMLAASGAKVAIIARHPGRLAEASEKIRKRGLTRSYHLDVTNIKAIAPVVNRVREDIGEIDILLD